MRWIEAAIPTKSGEIDELCLRLTELGVEGMSIEDEADFRSFLENNRKYWDYVDRELDERFAGLSQVKFYVSDDEEGRAVLERVRDGTGLEINTKTVDDEDWQNNWKEYYKPIPVGERLMVVPEWEDCDTGGRLPLRLEPGLTFGTGSHATTRMCLEALEGFAAPGKRALDLGCGSGILGIGAMVLGCDSVVGCDIDEKCPDVAAYNASLNGIGAESFKIYAGDILSDEGLRKFLGTGYDIVTANIVSDVIIPLSAFVRRFMGKDAVLITSGIIDGRENEVRAALEKNGFTILGHLHQEEWHCFIAR